MGGCEAGRRSHRHHEHDLRHARVLPDAAHSGGLYGLVANSVVERTRELGIRLALGATAPQAAAAAATPGLVLAAVGVAIGLAAARAAAVTLRHLVWGISIADPITFVVAGATVLGVTAFAAVVPALRIVRLNPISALRTT